MGVINKTTEQINSLLEKVEGMPEEGVVGKTPVLETGTTTTLPAGSNATSQVVANGIDSSGNPKYKLNFGIPKGQDGTSSGGGGVADSVQWNNVLNKPTWVNSATKPTYTATEVGALPATTTIPSKTSQLTNDSNFTTTSSFKTVNGQSIVGSGNIEISGTGSGIADAPSDGETYGRNNGNWVKVEAKAVNVYDLIMRVYQAASAQTKVAQEVYNTLLGYLENGTSLYMYEDGNSIAIELTLDSDKMIIIFKTPISIAGQDCACLYISNSTLDVTLLPITFVNKDYIASTVALKEYSKAETYTPITAEDTINSAIGKLEAGIGSGGGSSDDEFVIENTNINNIKVTDSKETLFGYIGGAENIKNIINAVSQGKKIVFKTTGVNGYLFNADVFIVLNNYLHISFTVPGESVSTGLVKKVSLKFSKLLSEDVELSSYIYLNGRSINSNVFNLTASSTDADIKEALPTSLLEELYLLANYGNKFYAKSLLSDTTNVYLTCTITKTNNDYTIMISSNGNLFAFNDQKTLRVIQYTAASNTYEVQA